MANIINNIHFLEVMINNPENLLDDSYSGAKEKLVITKTSESKNILIESNEKLIEYITAYKILRKEMRYDFSNSEIQKIIDNIIKILTVKGINLSAFSQYFMVQNLSHSIFSSLKKDDKRTILYYVLDAYIEKRHSTYMSHGYSNIILQVMSDNYSHKRKGKSGIEKILIQISKYNIPNLKTIDSDEYSNDFYILPDKGQKNLFLKILDKEKILFAFSKGKQGKIPDMLIKLNGEIYIIEHKNMKENGGGQDKQISEILDFIRYPEVNNKVHYITYLDGIFSNKLFPKANSKNLEQYKTALEVLISNPNNYFVNTIAFEDLLNHIKN